MLTDAWMNCRAHRHCWRFRAHRRCWVLSVMMLSLLLLTRYMQLNEVQSR